jgi:polysaccharide export outer membrane protein
MRRSQLRTLLVMIALCALLPVAIFAQDAPAAPSSASPQAAPTPANARVLRISTGDLIELGVFDTPELSGRLRVSESGEVMLPVAGAIRLAGMTSAEAAAAIEQRLLSTDILKNPHVSVFVAEYATQGVNVGGEVRNPGLYPLLGNHQLMDLISAAGGLNPSAGKAVTIAHKSDPEHPVIVLLDSKPGSVGPAIDVLPGDTIMVSRSGVVYVVGDVGKPGGFLIEGNDRLTVMQVLALAAGPNHTASQDKSRIFRKTNTGRLEFPVPVKQIVAGKAVDPMLEDGDILYIPYSASRAAVVRGAEAAIALTTGLIIYKGI